MMINVRSFCMLPLDRFKLPLTKISFCLLCLHLITGVSLYAQAKETSVKEPIEAKSQPEQTASETSVSDSKNTIPKSEWAYSNMLALRYNPLGLQDELYLGFKQKLYQKPESNVLFGKSYWWAGMAARVSPQFALAGLFFRTSPIAVLELQGVFARVQSLTQAADLPSYYTEGTKAAVQSTVSTQAPSGHIITQGWQSSLQARLQAKVGSIALRSTNLFRYFDLQGDEGSSQKDLFYDQTLDLVTPLQGLVYQNDVDLLYADSNKDWVLGSRYTLAKSMANDVDAVLKEQMYSIQRLGLLFAWKFKAPLTAEGLEAKKRHALIILSQWHLDHSHRAGQAMNQAIPYFAVVYALSGRLDSK